MKKKKKKPSLLRLPPAEQVVLHVPVVVTPHKQTTRSSRPPPIASELASSASSASSTHVNPALSSRLIAASTSVTLGPVTMWDLAPSWRSLRALSSRSVNIIITFTDARETVAAQVFTLARNARCTACSRASSRSARALRANLEQRHVLQEVILPAGFLMRGESERVGSPNA